MPWRELKPMDLKVMFIAEYLSEKHSFSRLCRTIRSAAKTGYKWVERYELEGPSGLDERSRRRHNQTYVVPLVVRQAIIELRSTGETVPGPKDPERPDKAFSGAGSAVENDHLQHP